MQWIVLASVDLNRPSAYVLHLRGLVMGLLQSSQKITLVIPNIENKKIFDVLFSHENLTVITYHNPFKFSFLGTFMALPMIRRLSKHGDIVLYSRFNLLSFLLLKNIKIPCKITEHNGLLEDELKLLLPFRWTFLRKIGAYLQRLDAHHATIIRTVTPQIKNYLVKNGIKASKIIVTSNGTDTHLFYPQDRLRSLEKFKLHPDRFYIGFIGSITKWQAVDDLIQAFLKISYLPIDVLIAGDGSELSFLKKISSSVSNRLHFLGKIDILDAPGVINCFDIAVAPMRGELYKSSGSSKIKIRDYAACGRTILTGNTTEHQHLEEKGVLMTYSMDDVSDLAQKIQCLYKDLDQRKRMEHKSRIYAQENFSWNILVKNMLNSLNIS